MAATRWEEDYIPKTKSRCSRDIVASSTLTTFQPYRMCSNIHARLHCTDTTSGWQCSNGPNRQARTSTRCHFHQANNQDIVFLQLNLGEAVPTYSSAQQGISILMCRPKTAHEVKTIKDYEEARCAMAHTAQFNEVQRHWKTPPSPLPDNYFELRLSINTFCTLVWTLFGNECDYYKGLLKDCETLDQQEVHIIRDSFTADVCCRNT